MKGKILIFFLLLLCHISFGQEQITLTAKMPDCKNVQFLLLHGDEGGVFVVDQATVSSSGDLSISWEGEYGFYRLSSDIGVIDFSVLTSNFHFDLDGKPEEGELQFADKDENNQFHYYLSEFQMLNDGINSSREKLQQINEKDSIYKELHSNFKQLKKEKKILLKDLWSDHMDSWPARMALAQQELIPELKHKGKDYDEYYQKHFFDYFAFTDLILQATPIYYEKIGRYLKAHKLEQLLENQNFKKIEKAISTLFWLTELEPTSQKYLANYLMNRYPEEQFPEIYNITVDAYKVLNACEYVLASKTIKKRIVNSRNIREGWTAPDVQLKNSMSGKVQSLTDVNSELTLLIIWSGSCVHSEETLQRIKDLYPEYKDMGLEVVAISLDRNRNYWQETVNLNKYTWINACDTDGLTGDAASHFNIYVTPSIFLIDQSLKIVAVPQTLFQLENELVEFFK